MYEVDDIVDEVEVLLPEGRTLLCGKVRDVFPDRIRVEVTVRSGVEANVDTYIVLLDPETGQQKEES